MPSCPTCHRGLNDDGYNGMVVRNAILDLLKEKGPLNTTDICNELQMNRHNVAYQLNKMTRTMPELGLLYERVGQNMFYGFPKGANDG